MGAARHVTVSGTTMKSGEMFDRYRIDSRIGQGGMGEVYKAHDTKLGRAVALKVLRKDATASDGAARLVREACAAATIVHPNVIAIFDVGEVEGAPYIAMECVEGKTLRGCVGDASVPMDTRVRWLADIARALAAAHAKGVVHRDVKPENVMITHDGVVKVLDFGLARALSKTEDNLLATITRDGVITGTVPYMAPEALRAEDLDGRTDQFSWGVVAYELIVGRRPWLASGSAELVSEILSPRAPQPIAPALDLSDVVSRALAKSRTARFPTTDALVAEIELCRGREVGTIETIDRNAATRTTELPEENRPLRVRAVSRDAVARAAALLTALVILSLAIVTTVRRRRSTAASPPNDALYFDIDKVDADIVARCAPQARAPLRSGLQLWRDASQWESLARFDEAVAADPECAVASVYYLFGSTHTYPQRREHYRRAREHRGALNTRERELLDAMRPRVEDPSDMEEYLRRIAELAAKYPLDVDIERLHVGALFGLRRLDDAIAVVRAHDADHRAPLPGLLFVAAVIAVYQRDPDRAMESFRRCLDAAPDSADCLLWAGWLLASEGKCSEAESVLRRLVTVMPRSPQGHFSLGSVLLVMTRDPASARSVFEQRWRNSSATTFGSEPNPEVSRMSDELRMSVISGDLEGGLVHARRWDEAVRTSNIGAYRGAPRVQLIELLRELGRSDEARALALSGLHEQRGWSGDMLLDNEIEFARYAYVTDGIDSAKYRLLRDDWISRGKRTAEETWLKSYAGLAVVGRDAAIPFPTGTLVQDWYSMSPESFSRTAEELSAQGQHDDAIRHAEAANATCLAFRPMEKVHAEITLAKTYDRGGNAIKACESYAGFIAHFGKNRESVSSKFARERMKSLSCR